MGSGSITEIIVTSMQTKEWVRQELCVTCTGCDGHYIFKAWTKIFP